MPWLLAAWAALTPALPRALLSARCLPAGWLGLLVQSGVFFTFQHLSCAVSPAST